jgi:transcriptional regulator GlxA family with amidase domain
MERAREMLVAADPDASVTDVALACGFAHFGRFAGAYRERFGETPSETLHRARG